MPAEPERQEADDIFRSASANLSSLRELVASGGGKGASWRGRKQIDPDVPGALIDALEQTIADLRKAMKSQSTRLEQVEREAGESRALAEGFRELRGRLSHFETELVQSREKAERLQAEIDERFGEVEKGLRDELGKVAKGQTELAERERESAERHREAADDRSKLADELQDRIQQVLDEQRVCIRQLSLKTSEDAVLADRARRALELRLDALEGRTPKPDAE